MITGSSDRKDTAPRRTSRPYVLQAKATAAGQIKGIASVFNEVDLHGDVVRRGAFEKSLLSHERAGTLPVMLWAHDPSKPIGRWDQIRETSEGLEVEGALNLNTDAGRNAHEHLRGGDLNGLSIGYAAAPGGARREGPNRVLTELNLFEVSLVALPSNLNARVREMKQFETRAEVREFLRSTGMPRGAAEKLATGGWPALRGSTFTETETRHLASEIREIAGLFKGKNS